MKSLQPVARTYVGLVILAGSATVLYSSYSLLSNPVHPQWLILAALTLLTGSFTVKVPSISAYLSVSETFVFASLLMFGPEAGAITVLLECLIILIWMKPGRGPLHKLLFNMVAPAISIWLAGHAFFLTGIAPYALTVTPSPLRVVFLPLLGFTTLYFLLNSWLVAFALGFETRRSAVTIWWNHFIWLAVNYFSGASVAVLIVTRSLDASTLAIIVPLLLVSYLTFRTAMGRVEDSTIHLSELNSLYLSTIEALAMAIDAKDQITHGHIRRVQAYAVGLANRLGVSDDRLLKAIEAAALLHDMGKLAIPEHILNKPGKLTAAEFDKMKLHASVGADILSSISFPYPVVPIVRHHHENWDGTGYPDGLKGTDIPIGARILAVVDCFDALTSDRPYRPRLSDADAIDILTKRRASMYDPMIVDTFFAFHKEMSLKPIVDPLPTRIISAAVQAASALPSDPQHSVKPSLATDGSGRVTPPSHDMPIDTLVLAKYLKPLLPAVHAAVYMYESRSDEIVLLYAVGGALERMRGLRLQLGQGVSGWVAAARQTISNSDPILDFGDGSQSLCPPLRSCLSSPLILSDQLLGVLSVYAERADAFSDEHVKLVEARAGDIARVLDCVRTLGSINEADHLTGLPSVRGLEAFLLARATTAEPRSVLLLFIDIVGVTAINTQFGRAAGDEVIKYAGSCARDVIRTPDMLFRSYDDEFVAVLENGDVQTGSLVAQRIRERVRSGQVRVDAQTQIAVDVSVTYSPASRSASRDQGIRTLPREQLATLHQHPTPIVH